MKALRDSLEAAWLIVLQGIFTGPEEAGKRGREVGSNVLGGGTALSSPTED